MKIRFLLLTFFVIIQAYGQDPNDCVNAISVCGNGVFESNANGAGAIQEVVGCASIENNSIWLKVKIVQSGTLGFTLIPNNTSLVVDYDFWVYGPNVSCGTLGNPIRCNTTNPLAAGSLNNHTGMDNSTTDTQTGPGAIGTGYVAMLNVTVGESYYIIIDRPVGNDGFKLEWSGTANAGTGAFPVAPTANTISDVSICSTSNTGTFNLGALKSSINSDTTSNTISYFTTIANAVDNISALPNSYTNISNPEIIYAKVTSNSLGCYSISQFNLVVNLIPTASMSISNTATCSGSPTTISFSGSPNATIKYRIGSGPIITALLDATGNLTVIDSPTASTTYKLISANVLGANGIILCSTIINQSETLIVNPLPNATINDKIICLDKITGLTTEIYNLSTGLNSSNYTFEWFLNGTTISGETGSSLNITNGGNYSVKITNLTTGCISDFDAIVTESFLGQEISITQTDLSNDNHDIFVTISGGNATYLYQMDGGSYQSSNVFSNVSLGYHVVHVTDTINCTDLTKGIWVFGYPKFFTPNGDGINERWNVVNFKYNNVSKVSIFDRYGRIIKIINSFEEGWDGTYNGKKAISDDYWFVLDYAENGTNKTFKSHFSLKR